MYLKSCIDHCQMIKVLYDFLPYDILNLVYYNFSSEISSFPCTIKLDVFISYEIF